MDWTTEALSEKGAVRRVARKEWNCRASEALLGYDVIRRCTHARSEGVVEGTSGHWTVTKEQAEETRALLELRTLDQPCHGREIAESASVTVEPRRNPNHNPMCTDLPILPGETHIEYLAEAEAFRSGPRYHEKCWAALWEGGQR